MSLFCILTNTSGAASIVHFNGFVIGPQALAKVKACVSLGLDCTPVQTFDDLNDKVKAFIQANIEAPHETLTLTLDDFVAVEPNPNGALDAPPWMNRLPVCKLSTPTSMDYHIIEGWAFLSATTGPRMLWSQRAPNSMQDVASNTLLTTITSSDSVAMALGKNMKVMINGKTRYLCC